MQSFTPELSNKYQNIFNIWKVFSTFRAECQLKMPFQFTFLTFNSDAVSLEIVAFETCFWPSALATRKLQTVPSPPVHPARGQKIIK